MSNQWAKFSTSEKYESNNRSIPGGKYLGVGEHEVVIDAVEGALTVNGDPMIKISYVSAEDQSMRDTLFPLYGENGERQKSFKFKSLANALVPSDLGKDASKLRFKFFTAGKSFLSENPDYWPSLVGMHVVIGIVPGKRGYSIEDVGGSYKLVDMESKEDVVIPEHVGAANLFNTYKDARAVAEDMGLKRAWNSIEKFLPSEQAEANVEALSYVMDNAEVAA